jgi:hypothetical protein
MSPSTAGLPRCSCTDHRSAFDCGSLACRRSYYRLSLDVKRVFLDVQGERKDVVLLSTEHYMFCVLAWDADKGTALQRGTGDCRDSRVDLSCRLDLHAFG